MEEDEEMQTLNLKDMKKKNIMKVKRSKRRISTQEKDNENSENGKNSKDLKSDHDSESFDEKQLNKDKGKNTTQNEESANRDN